MYNSEVLDVFEKKISLWFRTLFLQRLCLC